ncbi:T9SS type A sorting domain-containing protein [Flavobacterium rakeshii]|uniref:T9SS type A sorting domain-containing protein n=1 Tax=Flavobacterium rakeshii TaxID=1038845 RepID=UPI002E7BB325|nr:T9SS type A sorting domain-containing protein [Flavobacterium rakeshii]MEE1899616.1 T9SS type A sorting domain-containing protein [Flavobacterium rakeshii]
MKSSYIYLTVFLLSVCGYSQCIQNGGFENGISGYTFSRNIPIMNGPDINDCSVDTGDFIAPIPAINPILNQFYQQDATLVDIGNDPFLYSYGISVPRVSTGTRAIKLNKTSGGDDIVTMSKTVQSGNTNFINFDFSLIASEHPDEPGKQPFFSARLYDQNNNIVNINEICLKPDSNNPLFSVYTTQDNYGDDYYINYTGWQCAKLYFPDEFINTPLRLEFIIADCTEYGHFATVYIDNITCENTCNSSFLGNLKLNPLNYNCPKDPFSVCGTYAAPQNATLTSMSLKIIENGTVVTTLNNPQILNGSFCFVINPAILGNSGNYELYVSAVFTMSNGSNYTLFDSSSVAGSDINFGINTEDAVVNGSILSWSDISYGYIIEFVADGNCCPDNPAPTVTTSYNTTLSNNYFDLASISELFNYNCFRWRIKALDCGDFSSWCCLAYDGSAYSNLLEDQCYPEGLEPCLPNYHAVITETGNSFEQREQWITAVNTIQNGADVTYKAGNYVELQPGFNTLTGAIFIAQIENCVIQQEITSATATALKSKYEGNLLENNLASKNHSNFTVYPNPTNSTITVKFEDSVSQFSIYDVTGKQLISIANTTENEVVIDLSNLANGIYFLTADGTPIQKVIKN